MSDKELPRGWFLPEDIEEYRRLVEEVPSGGTIGELGCYKGRSLCSVADIIKRKGLCVIVVDNFVGVGLKPLPPAELKKIFEDNMKRFGLKIVLIHDSAENAAKSCDDKIFDLLFIDANHSYDSVKRDLENWEPKVRGVIAGHDYASHEGVSKAVDERYGNVTVGGSLQGSRYGGIWSRRLPQE